MRVSSASGQPTVLANLTQESIDPRWPQVLPGARHVLFTAVGPQGPNGASIEALSLTDGTRKVLINGGTFGRDLSDGHLIYVNQGTLFAVRFDLERMEVSPDTPVPLLDDVMYSLTFGFAQLDVSRTGTLVYRRSTARGQLIAESIDGSDRTEPQLTTPGAVHLSDSVTRWTTPGSCGHGERHIECPDLRTPRRSLGTYECVARRVPSAVESRRSLPGARQHERPALVQAGRRGPPEAFDSKQHDTSPVVVHAGRNTPCLPRKGSVDRVRSLDSSLPCDRRRPHCGRARALSPDTRGKPKPIPPSHPMVDGSRMARGIREMGSDVRPFPNNGAREVQVSHGGGRIPRWLPNGHELLYRTDDQRLMVATYTVHGGSFVAEKPRPWWAGQLADTGVLSNFDLDQAGRALALMPAARHEGRQSPNHATVTLNFSDEVRRRVDGSKK